MIYRKFLSLLLSHSAQLYLMMTNITSLAKFVTSHRSGLPPHLAHPLWHASLPSMLPVHKQRLHCSLRHGISKQIEAKLWRRRRSRARVAGDDGERGEDGDGGGSRRRCPDHNHQPTRQFPLSWRWFLFPSLFALPGVFFCSWLCSILPRSPSSSLLKCVVLTCSRI